jgi:hypothetical protein
MSLVLVASVRNTSQAHMMEMKKLTCYIWFLAKFLLFLLPYDFAQLVRHDIRFVRGSQRVVEIMWLLL